MRSRRMRQIKYTVVHCSDSSPYWDIGAAEIDKWHKERGWDGIGYHYVIRRSGVLEKGREQETVGAHVLGYNANSLGICLVGGWHGKFDYTRFQMSVLELLLGTLETEHPESLVVGHYNLDMKKTCPNFDVTRWWGG